MEKNNGSGQPNQTFNWYDRIWMDIKPNQNGGIDKPMNDSPVKV